MPRHRYAVQYRDDDDDSTRVSVAKRRQRARHRSAMGIFSKRLAGLNTQTATPTRFVFVAYDQLNDAFVPDALDVGVVVVECPQKAARRPYHRQKLALVLSNLRHFALEQAARGHRVVHIVSEGDYASALRAFAATHGPLACARPAERELRVELQPLVDDGALVFTAHPGWLSSDDDFAASSTRGAAPWRMDAFYRALRRRTGWLMDGDKPRGGRFSFDGDNRQRWPGTPAAPTPPRFAVDDLTAEVCELVLRRFSSHPGTLDPTTLPTTAADAAALWSWAKASCLPHFGPFEDAMSTSSRGLFHTRISPLLNLHRLLPQMIVDDVLALSLPLSSQEGFLRQVIGWREFVRHVHEHTDGFRRGSGGDANGAPSVLGAHEPLPPAFWSSSSAATPSGLACLDRVVGDVWAEGYSHHITRLMVLSNIATLLDVEPRALTDWFWVAYVDAYDWVVEPNVLGMGTFAAGDVMTTKPYVAGSAYIDKMSDFCATCAFKPKKPVDDGGCPLTSLYWAFLHRHDDVLAHVERMKLPLASARKRTATQKVDDERVYAITRRALTSAERLTPAHFRRP
jgi:deoxyribodipyrimidine photolyase-related protein